MSSIPNNNNNNNNNNYNEYINHNDNNVHDFDDFDDDNLELNDEDLIIEEEEEEDVNDDHNDNDSYSDNNIIMDGRMSPKKQTSTTINLNEINHNNDNNNNNNNNNSSQLSSQLPLSLPQVTVSDYILGTLIVRVIAARDLKPIINTKHNNNNNGIMTTGKIVGSIKNVIFHHDNDNNDNDSKPKAKQQPQPQSSKYQSRSRYHHHRNKRTIHGTANPYATITFANQTEVTSTVYNTIHPSFPRHEQAYFDVSLPITHLAHEEQHQQQKNDNPNTSNLNQKISIEITKQQQQQQQHSNLSSYVPPPPLISPQPPILNVVLRHDDHDSSDCNNDDCYKPMRKKGSNDSLKKNNSGNKDDISNNNQSYFLGQASIDVTKLITGKMTYIDEWIQLRPYNSMNNSNNDDEDENEDEDENIMDKITGQIRIICEYDMTDIPPRPGDLVRFNGFVNPMDVFPIPATQIFRVDNILDENNDDILVLSYRSKPEDWYCTFLAHRFMFISVERHITAIERYHDEIIDIVTKVVSSPAIDVVQKTMTRLPEEGLLFMGVEASLAGLGLASRWLKGGVGTMIDDIVYATNLDGNSVIIRAHDEGDDDDDDEENSDDLSIDSSDDDMSNLQLKDSDLSLDLDCNSSDADNKKIESNKLPTMPCCPISGMPMKEPVVAADGHTYEKKAISRWFRTSNKSPLTGQELPHTDLIPNYLLISTFQGGHVQV